MYNPFDREPPLSARACSRRRLTPGYTVSGNEPPAASKVIPRASHGLGAPRCSLVNPFPRRAPLNSPEWTRLSSRNRDFNDCFNCGTRLGAVSPKRSLFRDRGIDNSPVRVEANEIVDVGNPGCSPLRQLEIEIRYTCTVVTIRSLGRRGFFFLSRARVSYGGGGTCPDLSGRSNRVPH